jgi:hypothetical protein
VVPDKRQETGRRKSLFAVNFLLTVTFCLLVLITPRDTNPELF